MISVPQQGEGRPTEDALSTDMTENKTNETAAQQYDKYPDPDAIVHFADASEELVGLITETLETSEFLSTSREELPETTLLVEEVTDE